MEKNPQTRKLDKMRLERNIVEKKKDKTPEEQSEVQMGNMPEKEFRVSIIKMIQDLRKRMEAHNEKT